MKSIVIYGKPNCKFCILAKELVQRTENTVLEYIDIQEKGIGAEELSKIVGVTVKTIPQIFIDGVYIGGYQELNKELS